MIAVIFEVTPHPNYQDEYFQIAAELKSSLVNIEGFISIERFQSLVSPNKYLSLSFWQDEKSVKTWRTQFDHKNAQQQGKNRIFENYHLRVASVVRDYGMSTRSECPIDNKG